MDSYYALIRSISCFLHDEKDPSLEKLGSAELKNLYKLAFKYDLIQIVHFALRKNGLAQNDEVSSLFLEGCFRSLSRYENSEYDLKKIKNALNLAGINYIPLKGAVIRKFYREPYYRTAGDVDVLVKKEDMQAVDKVFKKELQYKLKSGTGYDRLYRTPSQGIVELHFELTEEGMAGNSYKELKNVWEYAERKGVGTEYTLYPEFFYFYHVAHMAKHFESGSLGIRPFIDLYILSDKTGNGEKLEELLVKSKLKKFHDVAKKLCEVWFERKTHDGDTEKMESFVFGGGAFGSYEMKTSVIKRRKGGRKGYIFSRIFMPYNKLINYYPSLEKHKWLLPLYEIRRWFRLFKKKKRKIALRDAAYSKTISTEKGEELYEFCKTLDIGR